MKYPLTILFGEPTGEYLDGSMVATITPINGTYHIVIACRCHGDYMAEDTVYNERDILPFILSHEQY